MCIKPAAALWFIMVPVMDAVAMMLRRMVNGRSPFSPDREHLHHIFLLAGYSVNQTVAIMASARGRWRRDGPRQHLVELA